MASLWRWPPAMCVRTQASRMLATWFAMIVLSCVSTQSTQLPPSAHGWARALPQERQSLLGMGLRGLALHGEARYTADATAWRQGMDSVAHAVGLRGGGYDPFAKPKDPAPGKAGPGKGGSKGGMSDAERRIADIEAEMARTQKNKATMSHLCALKARLAALKRTVTEQQTKKGSKPGEGFDVRATGDARVGFIGFPSVGKSTLLTQLTGVESEAADYEFTTLTCIPGVMYHKGARVQILDLPGIIEGAKDGKGRGRQVTLEG